MKAIIIISSVFFSMSCNNFTHQDNFKKFLNSFLECSFPLNTDLYFNELNIYANNSCDISQHEFNSFLIDPDDTFWKYEIYNESEDYYYNYVKACRLNISEKFLGILYFRSYYCDNLDEEKSELIMSIFNKKGSMISSLPIAGGYGDGITFSSIIHNEKKIEVNYIKYDLETVKKTSKTFEITEDGEIKNIK